MRTFVIVPGTVSFDLSWQKGRTGIVTEGIWFID